MAHRLIPLTPPFFFHFTLPLKEHGNEADFLGFLQESVPHRSLTLPFEPFRYWLRLRRDIRNNRKTTPRLGKLASGRLSDSASQGVNDSPTRLLKFWKKTRQVGESLTPRLGESGSCHGESGSHYSNFLKFIIDFPNFKRLNQPFKRSIQFDKKEAIDLCKGLKKIVSLGNLVDSPTRQVGESFFDYEYLRELEAKIGTAGNVV
jgi:hypothetical protein